LYFPIDKGPVLLPECVTGLVLQSAGQAFFVPVNFCGESFWKKVIEKNRGCNIPYGGI